MEQASASVQRVPPLVTYGAYPVVAFGTLATALGLMPQTYASHLRLPLIWPSLTAEAGEPREP
jgi:hypothetical protein